MTTSLKIAIETYSSLIGNMSIEQVAKAIADGNESVKRSILMLMSVTA